MDDRVGKATWFDLMATDAVDAMAFYEGLLGWKFLRMKEPALADYWLIQAGDELIGGLRQTGKTPEGGPVIYFTVHELSPAVARARELGAKTVGERVELGADRGCYQWITDRQKNTVALWAPR